MISNFANSYTKSLFLNFLLTTFLTETLTTGLMRSPQINSMENLEGEKRLWRNQKPPNKHTFYKEKNSKTQNSVAAMNLSPVSLTGSHRHHFESFRTSLGLGLPRFCLPLSGHNSLVTVSLYPFRLTLALLPFSSVEVGLKSITLSHYSQALSSQTLSLPSGSPLNWSKWRWWAKQILFIINNWIFVNFLLEYVRYDLRLMMILKKGVVMLC